MITFDDRGLLTAVVQDVHTKEVLMVAHMNREALKRTIAGPHVWFYSRSRKSLWEKGSTSGDYLNVVDLKLDCDGDALLVMAEPVGAACHTGKISCFHKAVDANRNFISSGTWHRQNVMLPQGGRCERRNFISGGTWNPFRIGRHHLPSLVRAPFAVSKGQAVNGGVLHGGLLAKSGRDA